MRTRNNRIAIRITNEDYEKIQRYVKRSFFPKEALLRYIIAGYPIQEEPTQDAIKFLVVFRKVGSIIGNLCLKYDLKNTPIGEELEAVMKMMYETDRSLRRMHYVHYDNKLKKQIRKFKKEAPGGMPRIIEDDLYYRVQEILNRNKRAQAKTKGDDAYILTTKLFCGHCKEMMIGVCGTGKSGAVYHYYVCKSARKKKCEKKSISKQLIEDLVINECLKMLTDEKMQYIAKKIAEECNRNPDNLSIKNLKSSIKEIDEAIENMWLSIEKGGDAVALTERINRRQAEKEELVEQLAIEQNKRVLLSEAQILAFLNYVCEMPGDDMAKRRAIINIFVHSVYLYDDHLTLIINASNKPVTIDDIPLDDIEATFNGEKSAMEQCSNTSDFVPPKKALANRKCFFYPIRRIGM